MLPTIVCQMAAVLPGPPDVVWELVTDWEHQADWMLEMSNLAVLTPFRDGVGVEAKATIRIGGIRTNDHIRVTVWEPSRRLTIEHLGWVRGTGDFLLSPLVEGATHMLWREELRPPWGVAGALGMRAFHPFMLRTFRRDLQVLEGLVRARTGGAV